MRYGVLSDIHGNLHALEAALAVLSRARVDAYVCAGDLVGYGPFPNECVERIAVLDAVCVLGNHDLMAVGRRGHEGVSQLARQSLFWTLGVLKEDVRRYLQALPTIADIGKLVIAHGSLEDADEYVLRADRAREQLLKLAREHPAARILVLGHTHRAWACAERTGVMKLAANRCARLPADERLLMNPGSVGQSRERRVYARFGLLDLEQSTVTVYAADYDVVACRRALARRGLPTDAYHLPPSRRQAARTFAVTLRDRFAARACAR